jgi:predicted methyltransferase
MYELKKIGKLFTSKYVGTGPSSYKKRIYRAVVSQRLRNIGVGYTTMVRWKQGSGLQFAHSELLLAYEIK